MLPEGTPVYNRPNDGSEFLYGAYGVPTVFRKLEDYSSIEESHNLVRTGLCDIAVRPDVRDAVEEIGVEYVLVLDQGDGSDEYRFVLALSSYGYWDGIDGITDETDGFETVLARDDMRLYRIIV